MVLHHLPRDPEERGAGQGPGSSVLQISPLPVGPLPDLGPALHSRALLLLLRTRDVLSSAHLPGRSHLAHDRLAFHLLRRQGVLAEGRLPQPVFLSLHGRKRAVQHLHPQLDQDGPAAHPFRQTLAGDIFVSKDVEHFIL